jgi:hypothetical protein
MAREVWKQHYAFLYEKQDGNLAWNDVDEKSWKRVHAQTCGTVRVDYDDERASINIYVWAAYLLTPEVISMANQVMRPFYRLRSQGV